MNTALIFASFHQGKDESWFPFPANPYQQLGNESKNIITSHNISSKNPYYRQAKLPDLSYLPFPS